MKSEIVAMVDHLALKNSVEFLGQISDVSSQLMQTGLMLISSHFESYPMVITEVLAHGVPILCN